jgi:putative flippase GtrA
MEIQPAVRRSYAAAVVRSDELGRLVRFGLVGASGYVVNLVAFWLLLGAGIGYAGAAVGSFAVAVASNYALNRLWTFKADRAGVVDQGIRFVVIALLGLGCNVLLLHAFVRGGLQPIVAQTVAIALVTPLNYAGNRLWAFNERARLAAARVAVYRRILGWAIVSRIVVFGTTLLLQAVNWPHPAVWNGHQATRPFALLAAWDGRWYTLLAQRGYVAIPSHQSDTAFFPLYPALMHLLYLAGIPLHAGGLLLANLGFLLGVIAVYELVRTWLPDATAKRAAVYAALFPAGFVYSMIYPEGIVLAAMAGAGVLAAQRRWRWAAVLAAVATLSRPEGLFVALPLAALAFRQRRETDRGAALAAVLAAPAALAAVCTYQYLTVGNALAFSNAQSAWGRRLSPLGLERAVLEIVHAHGQNHWLYRDAAFCVLYVLLLALAWRIGVPRSWVLAGALIVLLPLESGSFTSDARFGLLALPVYAGLAWLGSRRWADVLLRGSMLLLLVAGTATVLVRWP